MQQKKQQENVMRNESKENEIEGEVTEVYHNGEYTKVFINGSKFNIFYNDDSSKKTIARSLAVGNIIRGVYIKKDNLPAYLLNFEIVNVKAGKVDERSEIKKKEDPIQDSEINHAFNKLPIDAQAMIKAGCELYSNNGIEMTFTEVVEEVLRVYRKI